MSIGHPHRLYRLVDNVPRHRHSFFLPEPMDSTDCLRFGHGVPLWLENVDRAGGYEIDTVVGMLLDIH
jgi:hypothetical protein